MQREHHSWSYLNTNITKYYSSENPLHKTQNQVLNDLYVGPAIAVDDTRRVGECTQVFDVLTTHTDLHTSSTHYAPVCLDFSPTPKHGQGFTPSFNTSGASTKTSVSSTKTIPSSAISNLANMVLPTDDAH